MRLLRITLILSWTLSAQAVLSAQAPLCIRAQSVPGIGSRVWGFVKSTAKVLLPGSSKMDQVLEAYGGLDRSLENPAVEKDLMSSFNWRYAKSKYQDMREKSEAIFRLQKGLKSLRIEADFTLSPNLNETQRRQQLALMSDAYMAMQIDPELRGLDFEQRAYARVAATAYLKESGLLPENFKFNPMENPAGAKFQLDSRGGFDIYLQLQRFANPDRNDVRDYETGVMKQWTWWLSTTDIPAAQSRSPLRLLHGQEATRMIHWLDVNPSRGVPDFEQVRIAQNMIGGRTVSFEVLLRQADGSWKPLMFQVEENHLIPVQRVNGEERKQFCLRCHTGLNAGIARPMQVIRSEDELANELRGLSNTTIPRGFISDLFSR